MNSIDTDSVLLLKQKSIDVSSLGTQNIDLVHDVTMNSLVE